MIEAESGRAALDLAAGLVDAGTSDDAARVVVGWLQSTAPERSWAVLVVVDLETAVVAAGPGVGARVRIDEEVGVVLDDLPGGPPAHAIVLDVATELGTWGHLVGDDRDLALAEAGAAALRRAVAATQARAELHDRLDRLEEAQSVAHMGSYDWDITTDVNRWSDELYRIYGHAPQSFNASYERFQSMVHPDDREMVQAVHQEAYATGEPSHTVERIVRPDGEVRVLDTTGRVIRDHAGRPVRMAGVCIDITERWEDQQAATRNAERFRLLVETAPEALLVVDPRGQVAQVNERATVLFGADRGTLVGQPVTGLLPAGLPQLQHGADPAAEARDCEARRPDGTTFPADVTVGMTEGGLAVAFVRDATDRLREQDQRQRDQAAQLRRVQALEINDNVLQGLAAAIYTLEQDDAAGALGITRATLSSARALVADLLSELGESEVAAGSLVRADPAPRVRGDDAPAIAVTPPPTGATGVVAAHRVVVVDDADDLRMIFQLTLDATDDFRVVGVAADGREALEVCQRERPDLVLLDLSMPVMDGLEALPLLRERLPDAAVVVLSGFDAGHVEQQVLDLGAVAYIEKGTPQRALVDRLRGVVRGTSRQGLATP